MGMLDGKVAIVSGSTSGMGRASVIAFAAEGAKVVVVGRGHEESMVRGKEVVDEIQSAGGEAILVAADATREEDVERLIATTIETYGQLDVLFNVAGGGNTSPTLERTTVKEWHRILDLNLVSSFMTIKCAMPHLLKTGGSIINTSSVAGLKPVLPGQYSYAAANAGLHMFTQSLARDYAARGVRANVITPGVITTPIWKSAPPELLDNLLSRVPIQRPGSPEEIAGAALFLASDLSSYVTGQVICVDGGQSIG